ncbi:MAG: hypothetical protein ACYS0G_15825, partial [Planctomycetota bacterium]
MNDALWGLVLLMLVPAAAAALLRRARCPGWPVVGGVLAGIVLGPTILGRVLPDRYAQVFSGGTRQHQTLRELAGRQGADLVAAEQAGYDTEQMARLQERHAREHDEAENAWRAAQWLHQRPLRIFAFVLVALMLLGAGPVGVGRSPNGQSLVGPLSVGAWSAALPGGLAFFAMRWWWHQGVGESALVAAAVAIGPWVLTAIDRDAADQAEVGGARMVQTAGRIATGLALVAAGWGLWSAQGRTGLTMGAPLLAAPLGSILYRMDARWAGRALDNLLIPAVAASLAVKVDLYEDFAVWPIAVFLLLSGDGRWLGAFTGAMILGGRSGLRTMRLVLGSMAAAPTQLAVTVIAAHTSLIPPRFVLALLLGAVLIEVTTPGRRSMARRLIQTEEELEKAEGLR